MAGAALTTAATLLCPHGGTVSIASTNARVQAGAALALQADTFTIAGCPFNVSGAASPCVRVQWVVADSRVAVNGTPTISQGSTGLCLNAFGAPQGPVSILTTQPRVQTQ